ncbi:hypothetical protein [Endozoicomonas lisbonensis]
MVFKQHIHSLVFAYIVGVLYSSLVYADETRYYVVLVNGTLRQAEVVHTRTSLSDHSGRVSTHIEGVGSLTYSYVQENNSPTGYVLTVTEPPSNNDNSVLVNGIAVNYCLYRDDYPDDLYFWLEESPAVSLDGITLQLPVFRIQSAELQPRRSVRSHSFGGYHYSAPNSMDAYTEWLINNRFDLIQLSSASFRMTRIQVPEVYSPLPDPKPEKSDVKSESSEDSDYESLLSDLSDLNLDDFKKDREDDDDPGAPCLHRYFRQTTLVPALISCETASHSQLNTTRETPLWTNLKEQSTTTGSLYHHLIKTTLITFMINELRPM